MKKINKLWMALSLGTIIIIGCKKHDVEKPTIIIHEPMQNDTISLSQDSVHLMASISDNEELHEATVEVTMNGNQIYFDTPLVHDSTFIEYHKHFVPTGIVSSQKATLTIIASDHHDNFDTASVDFWIKP